MFWIDTDLLAGRSSVLMTFISRGPFGRINMPIAVSRGALLQRNLTAAAHGNGMLAVWMHYGVLGAEIRAQLLDSSAQPVRPSEGVIRGEFPLLASNGEVALLAARSGARWIAQRLDRDARPLGPPIDLPFAVSTVSWDGTAFVIELGGQRAMRMDEAGVLLTPEPVFFGTPGFGYPTTFATSPHGALFVFVAPRVANEFRTRVVHAQSLSRDFKPGGPPHAVSLFDAGSVAALWRGDHYVVAYGASANDIRIIRVGADGRPLDDLFGVPVAASSHGPWKLGLAGSRLIIASRVAVTDVDSRTSVAQPDPMYDVSAIVTTRDGRTWLFWPAYDRPGFARELTFD